MEIYRANNLNTGLGNVYEVREKKFLRNHILDFSGCSTPDILPRTTTFWSQHSDLKIGA